MLPGSRWLQSWLARVGLTEWVNALRALLRWDRGGEPLDVQPAVRTDKPHPPPSEPTMPTKKAKSQKTSRPSRAKTPRSAAKPAAKKTVAKAAAKRGAAASKRNSAPRTATAESVKRLVEALQAHPQQRDIISAGQEKDQLLRSLIPFYLARSLDVEVTSGTTSRFWSELGVTYAAPNAAKALRIHTGYVSETKKGKAITAKGIRYVEDAINRG